MSQSQSHRLSDMPALPTIPNVKVGNTIGHGGFGIVKLGQVLQTGSNGHKSGSIYVAIKYIYLPMAKEKGVTVETIAKEAYIQKTVSKHPNVIKMLDFSYKEPWSWIVLELGQQGELFEKIEPDIGVDAGVAHFYFSQLINAVEHLHSMGVAHRDIKPENLILNRDGDLKITDFGLATVFKKGNGPKKLSKEICGSPPYVAPEIVEGSYDAEMADIWSCGIVLYVMLTGKIAWEMPSVETDPDYADFVAKNGTILSGGWSKLDLPALAMIKRILNPVIEKRASIKNIRESNWMKQEHGLLNEKGLCKNPKKLAARLMVNLYINLSDSEFEKATQYSQVRESGKKRIDTQPPMQIVDDLRESRIHVEHYAMSQVEYSLSSKRQKLSKSNGGLYQRELDLIAMDPAILQFCKQESIDMEERERMIDSQLEKHTKEMRKNPELYADRMTRFFSFASLEDIMSLVIEVLKQLSIYDADLDLEIKAIASQVGKNDDYKGTVRFPVNFIDDNNSALVGEITIGRMMDNLEAKKIEFIRKIGDPLEWRRLFKRITILCRDIVYYPE